MLDDIHSLSKGVQALRHYTLNAYDKPMQVLNVQLNQALKFRRTLITLVSLLLPVNNGITTSGLYGLITDLANDRHIFHKLAAEIMVYKPQPECGEFCQTVRSQYHDA